MLISLDIFSHALSAWNSEGLATQSLILSDGLASGRLNEGAKDIRQYSAAGYCPIRRLGLNPHRKGHLTLSPGHGNPRTVPGLFFLFQRCTQIPSLQVLVSYVSW